MTQQEKEAPSLTDQLHDARRKLRQFRRMVKALVQQIPIKHDWESTLKRADGDCDCLTCGLPYFEHPVSPEHEKLRLLCNGDRVKP